MKNEYSATYILKQPEHHVSIRNIVLRKQTYDTLKKIKECLFGNIANAIECGNWMFPYHSYDYGELKLMMEFAFHTFYDIPEDVEIDIKRFDSDILSFESGIYPDYSKGRK